MSELTAPRRTTSRLPQMALCAAMPLLGAGYQVAAKATALDLAGVPFGVGWFTKLVTLPSVAVLLAIEIVSFAVWMTVLATMKLSAAFPLTALGYVLSVGAGWLLFHEPAHSLQLLGGGAILSGIWLLGRAPEGAESK